MRTISTAIKLALCATCLTSAAHAFDPNAGVDPTPQPIARYQPLPESVVPHRYYAPQVLSSNAAYGVPVANAAPAPAAIAPLPAAAAAPAPAIIAPLPETRSIPVEQPAPAPNYYAQQPVMDVTPVAPAYVAPAPVYVAPYQPYQQPAAMEYKKNRFSLGVEAFWDRYREDIANLESNSGYGAIDGGWSHYYTPNWFHTVELRGSFGSEDYKSDSGKLNGTDQWEFEGRFLGGYDLATGNGGHIKPYIGVDMRYYRDEGKGGVTSLGFSAYDRRIFQAMAPIGVTYDMPSSTGFHYLPTIEFGPLLYGNVSTRLQNIPGYYYIENQQHTGYEIRADFMMNNLNAAGRGWEFGPFVRYWKFDDSDVAHSPPAGPFNTTDWIEPKNSRLQLGAKLKYLF